MKDILVVKLGSSTLTNGTDRISRGKLEELATQILALKDQYNIVIVSSGAIATAKQFVSNQDWIDKVASKQALSAIGQPKLIQLYAEVFSDFDLKIAQCLLTFRDFEKDSTRSNIINTINVLLNHDYIPIINENDTVAVEEIEFGDNDKLSAQVATLVNASKLVLVSDVEGIFDKNPHLHDDAKLLREVHDIQQVTSYIDEKSDGPGTGGMTSKLDAARICQTQGIETIITKGTNPNFIVDAISGKLDCTVFKIKP